MDNTLMGQTYQLLPALFRWEVDRYQKFQIGGGLCFVLKFHLFHLKDFHRRGLYKQLAKLEIKYNYCSS